MLQKLIPRTVVGQLMAMLFAVLLVGQVINLVLLIGESRLQERSTAFESAIDYAVERIDRIPYDLPYNLPYGLPVEQGAPQGAFFISSVNRAEQRSDARHLRKYDQLFKTKLEMAGIHVLQTSVTFLDKGPAPDGMLPKGERPRRAEGRPPRFEDGSDFERGPPPLGGPRERGPRTGQVGPDGLFHPRQAPRLGGGERAQNLQEIRLSAELEEGVWFNAMMPHSATEVFGLRVAVATSLLLGITLLAAWFFSRRISRPLSELADAAERLGRGSDPVMMDETGPSDVQRAAQAFNTMQNRLTRTLETQRMMLRAVGHDLRTPLTSLRLRAENIPEDQGRDKFIATLNDMTVMTEEILSWAKDASGTEDIASVDLGAMLSSVTDDYQDQGFDVQLTPFQSVNVDIRRVSIKRALQNLINNAVKYGERAKVSVQIAYKRVYIHIDDEGPGIPEDRLQDILKPFVRLETSRSKDTGGTGLGLSIAESIAQIHGGKLELENRKPAGLRVTLVLPA